MSEKESSGRLTETKEVEQFTSATAEFVVTEMIEIKWCGRQIARSVTTYRLHGHPRATSAFTLRKFSRVKGQSALLFIVLDVDGVRSPEDALRYFLDRS